MGALFSLIPLLAELLSNRRRWVVLRRYYSPLPFPFRTPLPYPPDIDLDLACGGWGG